MSGAARLLADGVVLFVVAWVAIFGGLGALLAHARGGSPHLGLLIGLIGPIGWAIVWAATRDSHARRAGASAAEPFSDPLARDAPTPSDDEPFALEPTLDPWSLP